MTYSPQLVDFVKSQEDGPGFAAGRCTHLKAYRCPAGVWTSGWGHTRGVMESTVKTQEQADADILDDLDETAADLKAILPASVGMTQGQFDALCSLCFNLAGGPRALPNKAPKLWAALVHGDIHAAASQFLDIDKAVVDGVLTELPGLKARRQLESQMFEGITGTT